MKDNDFRQPADSVFAPLEWTDEKRIAALNAMTKEVPRMTITEAHDSFLVN